MNSGKAGEGSTSSCSEEDSVKPAAAAENRELSKVDFYEWTMAKYRQMKATPLFREAAKTLEDNMELFVKALLACYESKESDLGNLPKIAYDVLRSKLTLNNCQKECDELMHLVQPINELLPKIASWKEHLEQSKRNIYLKNAYQRAKNSTPPVLVTNKIPEGITAIPESKPLIPRGNRRSSTESRASTSTSSPRRPIEQPVDVCLGKPTDDKDDDEPPHKKANKDKEVPNEVVIAATVKPIKQEITIEEGEITEVDQSSKSDKQNGASNGQQQIVERASDDDYDDYSWGPSRRKKEAKCQVAQSPKLVEGTSQDLTTEHSPNLAMENADKNEGPKEQDQNVSALNKVKQEPTEEMEEQHVNTEENRDDNEEGKERAGNGDVQPRMEDEYEEEEEEDETEEEDDAEDEEEEGEDESDEGDVPMDGNGPMFPHLNWAKDPPLPDDIGQSNQRTNSPLQDAHVLSSSLSSSPKRPYSKIEVPLTSENENDAIGGLGDHSRKRRLELENEYETNTQMDRPSTSAESGICANKVIKLSPEKPSEFDIFDQFPTSSNSAVTVRARPTGKVKRFTRAQYEAEQKQKRLLACGGKMLRFSGEVKKRTYVIDEENKFKFSTAQYRQKSVFYAKPTTTTFLKNVSNSTNEDKHINQRKLGKQTKKEVHEIVAKVKERKEKKARQEEQEYEKEKLLGDAYIPLTPKEQLTAISRLIVTDSMLHRLDERVLKNVYVSRTLEHPKDMKNFVDDGLGANAGFLSNPANLVYFEFSYIFVIYGFDKITQEQIIPEPMDYFYKLYHWFETNLPFCEENKLMKRHDADSSYFYNPPMFVGVTIPEVGDQKHRTWIRNFNDTLRNFIDHGWQSEMRNAEEGQFMLLDWAKLVAEQPSATESEEERVRLLMMEMKNSFGVLFK